MSDSNQTPVPGRVYLVGAGPGDPRLISERGIECLRRADLILYDGLVHPLVLLHTSATAERTCRTRTPQGARLDQEAINRRMIEAAREGKTVVRLKGGDPFIFGRGGEEALALAEAGIPFEVVPGITAATAAAEYAGISLTHRAHASAVVFVTGHEDPAKPQNAVDYAMLARFQGTLVFYMGLHRLPLIVASLLEHGKPADTPAAVISQATTPAQRTITAPLAELPQRVEQAGLRPPSLIVIGECVRRREQIAWFEHLPLFGKRIGITRPMGQVRPVVERALELGAEPVLMPTIEILPPDDWSPVDAVLQRLAEFDWLVFTSANGVDGLFGRLWETGGDMRRVGQARIACIGPETARAVERWHLRAELVPTSFRAEHLAEALLPHVSGKQVLWARSNRAREVLSTTLKQAGAVLEQVIVYRNVDVEALPQDVRQRIADGKLDWIALSSPSIARNVARLLGEPERQQLEKPLRLASISPVTTAAAREAGLPIHAEAGEHTWEGLFAAIIEAEQRAAADSAAGGSGC